MSFAQNLDYLMISHGNMSNYRLSQIIDVSQTSIANWRKGLHEPYKNKIPKIAEVFHVSVDELMGAELPPVRFESERLPAAVKDDGRDATDKIILDFLRALPPERLRGILLGLGAPSEVLSALDREESPK